MPSIMARAATLNANSEIQREEKNVQKAIKEAAKRNDLGFAKLACLNEWASIERDHTNVLSWTIQDLQASTLRLPVTGGAKGDIETIKAAVCSAVDMIQVMGSAIGSIFQQVRCFC